MKFSNNIILFLATTAVTCSNAFVPVHLKQPSSSALFLQDTSEAVEAAMEASEKYGKTSQEARLAWNVVEELDAANSHERAMAKQIKKQQEEIERLQKLVVEKATSRAPTVHTDTSDAVKNALEASRLYGKQSPEARMAWDIVEELDSANSHHRPEDVHVATPKAVEASATEEDATVSQKALPETLDQAISAAMLATKVYGSHAVESRMAWELVEEMEASSSHKRDEVKLAEEETTAAEGKTKTVAVEVPAALIDTSKAIKAALEASKTHGKASVEARMAWEAVEEMDAINARRRASVN